MGEASKHAVLAAVEDLFFSAKIDAVAKGIGVPLVLAADCDQVWDFLEHLVPRLILIDLNSKSCAPIETIRRIKADPRLSDIPLIGFYSHVQVDLERAAREAGCDRVLARSAFSANLPTLLGERKLGGE